MDDEMKLILLNSLDKIIQCLQLRVLSCPIFYAAALCSSGTNEPLK